MRNITPKLFFLLLVLCTAAGCQDQKPGQPSAAGSNAQELPDSAGDQVWAMEEKYWQLVGDNDTVAYKNLWHDDFIGYPSFGAGTAGKKGIAVWVPALHADTSVRFSYRLYKKAVNVIDDVVMVFYDADEIWTNAGNEITRKETLKLTHTWKKYGNDWLILGGMAARKPD